MRLCFAFVPWCATRLLGNARLRPSPTLLPLVRPPTPSVALAPVPPLDCNILRCCAANMDAIAGAPVPPLVAPPFVPAAVPPPTQRSMCAFMAALPFGMGSVAPLAFGSFCAVQLGFLLAWWLLLRSQDSCVSARRQNLD